MRVRGATTADAEAMARVHTESSDAAYAHIGSAEPGAYERRLAVWREILAQEHSAFVAEDEHGAVLGVLSVGESREEDGVGEIYVIYVRPESWGSSAGQLLIECAHEVLAERYHEAELTVLADNPRARRFYERNGWTLAELRTEEHFGGQPTEVARYRRKLRPGL